MPNSPAQISSNTLPKETPRKISDLIALLLERGKSMPDWAWQSFAERAETLLTKRNLADMLDDVIRRGRAPGHSTGMLHDTLRIAVEIASPVLTSVDMDVPWGEQQEMLARIAAALFGAESRGWDRSPVSMLEILLKRPGLITSVPPDLTSGGFYLRSGTKFSALLKGIRIDLGLTQAQFAAPFRAWNLRQVAVSGWERGAYSPSRAQEGLVYQIAHRFNRGELYGAYEEERRSLEHKKPRAKARDVDFTSYLAPHSQEVRRLIALLGRGANSHTEAAYRGAIAHALAAASLPSSHAPRRRGLGWDIRRCSILAVLHPDVIAATHELVSARSKTASSHCKSLRDLATLVRPHGAFWRAAGDLLCADPTAKMWLTAHWPDDDELVDSPGAPCTTLLERVHAQCYLAHELYTELATDRRHRLLPATTRRRLREPLRSTGGRLMSAVFRFLRSVDLRGRMITDDQRGAAMVVSLLASAMLRPLLNGDDEWRRWRVEKSANDRYELVVIDAKGTEILRETFPPALARCVAPYHRLRSEITGGTYYLPPNRTGMSSRSMRHWLNRVIRIHAGALFPDGLAICDVAAIVATDLCSRYGMRAGSMLAAGRCRQTVTKIRARLVLVRGLRESSELTGPNLWQQALQDASRQADAIVLPAKSVRHFRQRRSANEILRWRRLRRGT